MDLLGPKTHFIQALEDFILQSLCARLFLHPKSAAHSPFPKLCLIFYIYLQDFFFIKSTLFKQSLQKSDVFNCEIHVTAQPFLLKSEIANIMCNDKYAIWSQKPLEFQWPTTGLNCCPFLNFWIELIFNTLKRKADYTREPKTIQETLGL